MEPTLTAPHPRETKLVAAQQGQLDSNVFMEERLDSQIFMPVEDEANPIQGFQRSTNASTLTLENEDGDVLPATAVSIAPQFRTPPEYVKSAPAVGAHNDAILKKLK